MKKGKSGYSIVEIIVSMAILCVIMPVIYGALINTQKIFYSSASENEMESEARRALEFIKSDLKQARAIFMPDNRGVSEFLGSVTDAVDGTVITASSVLLMKYTGDIDITMASGTKKLNRYKLIYYYMKRSEAAAKNFDSRSVIRAESESDFIDPTPLSSDETVFLTSEGYLSWIPPKTGYSPELSNPGSIRLNKRKLTLYTAPGGVRVKNFNIPEPGGFLLSQDNNRVMISLYSVRNTPNGIKKYAVTSEIVARGFLMK